MDQFYTVLLFGGVLLMVFLTVWTIFDKKKVFKVLKDFDKKKSELVEIINDAEQMIEELNKFSDYIVTQMDIKDEELRSNLRIADEQIMNLSRKAQSLELRTQSLEHREPLFSINSDIVIDNLEYEDLAAVNMKEAAPVLKRIDNVIPMNSRHAEVLKLSKDGLSDAEIAKKLKMGKGEIQLILEINKA
jgi:DNA-binding NarL/FixJ family response regulator